MNTEPASASAGGQASAVRPAGSRGGAFTLPVSTSFRFALLIAAVAVSSFMIYEGIYLATPRGLAFVSVLRTCQSRALSQRPSGLSAYVSMFHHEDVCLSGADHAEALWGLAGVGVLVVLAGAIYWAQPWWYRRRMHLSELTGEGSAALMSRLEELRERAGTGSVVWLLQPLNVHLSAFAFGRPRRRFVALSGGAAVGAVRQPAAFDAVVFHELAHVRNRDIDQTYQAMAIWRAFVVAALLPLAGLLIFSRYLGPTERLGWRVAALALIVYLLRNAIVRSREFDADARVQELDPDTSLGTMLARLPPRAGRRAWHLGWLHPSGQDRAAALLDPAPLYRCGFWDGLAVGLVAAIGASAGREIVTLLTTAYPVRRLIPAAIFAVFAGGALAVAMWRKQLRQTETGTVKGWAVGLGLGIGLAVGPIIALPAAFDHGLAPDNLSPAAIGVLAVWIGLAILIFMPLPVWVGHWADAWQERSGKTTPRVPARGGMRAASIAAWAVMTIGLDLLLTSFTILEGPSAAAIWHELAKDLRDSAPYITQQPGAWAVCLVAVAMPLAASLATGRWRRSDDARDAAPPRRRAAAVALLCLAGCLTATTLTLAVSAVAHARIAEPVRWSAFFLARLVSFDEQAIVAIAVVFALIVAAKARSARSIAIAVAVAAAVAAGGALALSNARTLASCIGSLSIQYTHPPAGHCLTDAGSTVLQPTAIGAALVSILFIPAAHHVSRMLAGRRTRRERLPAGAMTLRWLAAGAAVIAVIIGTALRGPVASAHGVKPMGSIGRDGWIRGYGYEIRLIPDWYALTPPGSPQLMRFTFPVDGATLDLQSFPLRNPAVIAAYKLLRIGARPALLDGARGLRIARSDLTGGVLEQWFVLHGPAGYLITLKGSPYDGVYLRDSLFRMLHSWHWTSPN